MALADFLRKLNQQFPIVNPDGTPTDYFMRLLQDNIKETGAAIGNPIEAGTGLAGGGSLADGPVSLSLDAVLDMLNDVDLTVAPTAGQVLEYDAVDGLWKAATPSSGGASAKLMIANDQPQELPAATWTKLLMNLTIHNGISGASLAANEVTLGEGTYLITGRAECIRSNEARLKLRNMTDGVDILSGSAVWSGNATGTGVGAWGYPTLFGKFTLTATKNLAIYQRDLLSSSAFTDNGYLGDVGALGYNAYTAEFTFEQLA